MTNSVLFFLAVTTVVIPLLALSGKRRLDQGFVIPRVPLYVEGLVFQTLLLSLSVFVARANQLSLPATPMVAVQDFAPALLLLLVAIVGMRISIHFSSVKTLERLLAIVPVTPNERILWVGVSAAAGIAEETAYRGVLFALAATVTDSWWVAALATSFIFALAHLVQGWRSAIFIGVFGLAFQALVWVTGALLPAIIVHFLYDLLTGIYLGHKFGSEEDDEQAL